MKALVFILFLFTLALHSQEWQLVALNLKSGEEITIKENKRIKIIVHSGKKIVGRLKILDDETVLLRKQPIAVNDIKKIKRHPLLISLVHSAGFMTLGLGSVGLSLSPVPTDDFTPQYIMLFSGIVLFSAAFFPINYWCKGYRASHGWQLKIMNSSDSENVERQQFTSQPIIHHE